MQHLSEFVPLSFSDLLKQMGKWVLNTWKRYNELTCVRSRTYVIFENKWKVKLPCDHSSVVILCSQRILLKRLAIQPVCENKLL